MKCMFNESANQCPFLKRDNGECVNKDKCSFQEIRQTPPVKKEKWYEKYYKRR